MVSGNYFIRYRNTRNRGPFIVYGGVNSDLEPSATYTLDEARAIVKDFMKDAGFHWRIQPVEEVATTDPRIEDYMDWLTYDWCAERPDQTAQDPRSNPGVVKVLIVREEDGSLNVHAATEAVHVMIVDPVEGAGEEQAQSRILSSDEIDQEYDNLIWW